MCQLMLLTGYRMNGPTADGACRVARPTLRMLPLYMNSQCALRLSSVVGTQSTTKTCDSPCHGWQDVEPMLLEPWSDHIEVSPPSLAGGQIGQGGACGYALLGSLGFYQRTRGSVNICTFLA